MIGLFEIVGIVIAILNLIAGVIGLRNRFYFGILNLVIVLVITLTIMEEII